MQRRNRRKLARAVTVRPLAERFGEGDWIKGWDKAFVVKGKPLNPSEVARLLMNDAPPLQQGDAPRRLAPHALAAAYLSGGFTLAASAFVCVGLLTAGGLAMDVRYMAGTTRVGLAFFFGASALVLLVAGAARAARSLYLVRKGRLTWAIITSLNVTMVQYIDPNYTRREYPSYHLTLAYPDENGALRIGDMDTLTPEALIDDEFELMLFDPDNPSRFQFADLLPNWLTISSTGQAAVSTLGYALAAVCAGLPLMLAIMLLLS